MSVARRDRGAVFPLYIWMVSGLLLIALIFFVFAQAAFTRSGGQSAADAAALAAAREARDQLYDDFLDAIGDEDSDLDDIVAGEGYETSAACDAAAELAGRNNATVRGCAAVVERNGYRVTVETTDTVGESVIPGTETATASATATAVIVGDCTVDNHDPDRVELSCDDGDWDFDPDDDSQLPEARDVFQIRLED